MLLPDEEPPTLYLTRWLFLRLLGGIYFIAFASLAVQITGLVGEHGLLPAGEFLDWAHYNYGAEAYRLLPTVFWIGSGDLALRRAIQRAYGFDHLPTDDEVLEVSDRWRPYRSLAVYYLFASEYDTPPA